MTGTRLGDAAGRLEDLAAVLGTNAAHWAARATPAGNAAQRQAASDAMAVLDAMLAELHRARAALVTELRVADDAALNGGGVMTAPERPTLATLIAALAELRRDHRYETDSTDESLDSLLLQVVAIEEILAARWPRSVLLRSRLRKELRASVADIDGHDFAVKRLNSIATGWITRPGSRWATGRRHAS